MAGRPDEGLLQHRDLWREALIRPSSTFSHRDATGEGKLFALTSPLLTTASGAKMGKKKHVLVKPA